MNVFFETSQSYNSDQVFHNCTRPTKVKCLEFRFLKNVQLIILYFIKRLCKTELKNRWFGHVDIPGMFTDAVLYLTQMSKMLIQISSARRLKDKSELAGDRWYRGGRMQIKHCSECRLPWQRYASPRLGRALRNYTAFTDCGCNNCMDSPLSTTMSGTIRPVHRPQQL